MQRELVDHVKQAKLKRRRYLVCRAVHAICLALFALGALFSIACCLLAIVWGDQGPWLTESAFFASLLTLPAGIFCYKARQSLRQLKEVPYVPPVRSQIAALPAEDVLLRGTQEPSAAPAELLRAAKNGVNAADELLRVFQEQEDPTEQAKLKRAWE